MLDLIMDWEQAAQIVKDFGWNGWMGYMTAKFPSHDFFQASQDWFRLGPEYIAKLKGASGDVLIGWRK